MAWRHPTEADWDRNRDYLKHEPRPGDPPSITPEQPPEPSVEGFTAKSLIALCRGLNDADAATAIQKYADAFASIKVERAVSEQNVRIISLLEGTFHPVKDGADA